MVVSLQYGLCARNQEVWGLRWSSLVDEFAWMLEVLSSGRLDEWARPQTARQARAWGQRFFTPAVEKATEQPELFATLGATPTHCAAAASPCAFAPRIHRPSPVNAAPACGCSQTTTPKRSRTSAATAHDRLIPSGAPRAPNE
jgi:hypothetical protein